MSEQEELDQLIARKVMGWRRVDDREGDENEDGSWDWWCDDSREELYRYSLYSVGARRDGGQVWAPSTNIAHAWEAIEKMAERKIYLDIIQVDDGWMAGHDPDGYTDDNGHVDLRFRNFVIATTAPLAICRAALLAVADP